MTVLLLTFSSTFHSYRRPRNPFFICPYGIFTTLERTKASRLKHRLSSRQGKGPSCDHVGIVLSCLFKLFERQYLQLHSWNDKPLNHGHCDAQIRTCVSHSIPYLAYIGSYDFVLFPFHTRIIGFINNFTLSRLRD